MLHEGQLMAFPPIAACQDYVGFSFFLFFFLNVHSPHWIMLLGTHLSTQRCKVWLEVCPSHGTVWTGNISVSLMWSSPTDRANVHNLGNFRQPQHCSRRQADESEKNLEKTQHLSWSSQGVETPLWLAQLARTIRSPKCRWSGVRYYLNVQNCLPIAINTSSSEEIGMEMQCLFLPKVPH